MKINYNRLSRVVWISDDNDLVVARVVTPLAKRCIDVAGELLNEHGYVRTGDYLLAGETSPVREAPIRKATTDAELRLHRNPETLAALRIAEARLDKAVDVVLDASGNPK